MPLRAGAAALLISVLLTAAAADLSAQSAAVVAQERSEFSAWLATAPLSPYAAIAVQPIGPGISIGPEPADIPLAAFPHGELTESATGAVLLRGAERIALSRGRAVTVGGYRLVADGEAGRRLVAVYGPIRAARAPAYYPFALETRVGVELAAPSRRGVFRTLGLDGIETQAEEVGLVTVAIGGSRTPLRVYRLGAAEDDDAELMIFFRDPTNGKGTYPAGRFVPLEPASGGKYLVDFNRARNPFCAYSTVFPCPAPWPGNTLPVAVEAGEKYLPH